MDYNLLTAEKKIKIFLLQGQIFDFNLIKKLKKKLLLKINNSATNYKTNVKAKMSEYDSFNEDKDFHDFIHLIIPYIKIIQEGKFFIHSAWGNIYKKKTDHTIMHDHKGCDFMSGVLYLTDKGPGTYFKEFNFNTNEKIGKFLLFSPEANHEVKPFDYKSKRMVISFNLNSFRQ